MVRAQNLVNLEAVTAHVPGDASRVLLDAVSLGIERGDRIGVVGLNGGGKTTLLDIVAGRREPQGGRVSRVGGLNLTHLAQGDAAPLPTGQAVDGAVQGRVVGRPACAARGKTEPVQHVADLRVGRPLVLGSVTREDDVADPRPDR